MYDEGAGGTGNFGCNSKEIEMAAINKKAAAQMVYITCGSLLKWQEDIAMLYKELFGRLLSRHPYNYKKLSDLYFLVHFLR